MQEAGNRLPLAPQAKWQVVEPILLAPYPASKQRQPAHDGGAYQQCIGCNANPGCQRAAPAAQQATKDTREKAGEDCYIESVD